MSLTLLEPRFNIIEESLCTMCKKVRTTTAVKYAAYGNEHLRPMCYKCCSEFISTIENRKREEKKRARRKKNLEKDLPDVEKWKKV